MVKSQQPRSIVLAIYARPARRTRLRVWLAPVFPLVFPLVFLLAIVLLWGVVLVMAANTL